MSSELEWTPEQDAVLKDLIAMGYTYDHVANHFVEYGIRPDATRDSVRSRARRIGATPTEMRAAEPPVQEIPGRRRDMEPGIVGGERFQKMTMPVRNGSRIVVLSDAQIPYHDERSILAVEDFMDDYQPDVIVWLGDMTDFYPLSKYDHNPVRQSSLQHELDITRERQSVQARRHRDAERVFVLGNHEDRLRRFLWEHPALVSLRSLDVDTLFGCDGAWRVLPYGSQIQISGTILEHGGPVRSKSGYSARALFEKRGTSVIMGHTHRLSQSSARNALGQHAIIENGCLCRLDPEYEAMPDWTQGFTYGFVNNGSVHWNATPILPDGFYAAGRFYKRER